MSLNATMTFAAGATTVTVPAPVPEYDADHHIAQAVGRTAAGTRYVYDKNVTSRVTRIVLELTAAQKSSLITFIDSTLDGAVNTFTWTDHHGTAHASCRLLNPGELNFTKLKSNRFSVTLEIATSEDLL